MRQWRTIGRAPKSRRGSTVRPRAAGIALIASVALVTGCGAGDDGGGVATAGDGAAASSEPSASADPEQQQLEFTQCLREHGVDVTVEGEGRMRIQADPSADVEEAMKACEDLRPEQGGVGAGPGGEMSEEQQQRFLAMAACMREEGIDVPDPEFSGGGVRMGGPGGDIDPNDPKVEAAFEKCSQEAGIELPDRTQSEADS